MQNNINIGTEAKTLKLGEKFFITLNSCDNFVIVSLPKLIEKTIQRNEVIEVDAGRSHFSTVCLILRFHEGRIYNTDLHLRHRLHIRELGGFATHYFCSIFFIYIINSSFHSISQTFHHLNSTILLGLKTLNFASMAYTILLGNMFERVSTQVKLRRHNKINNMLGSLNEFIGGQYKDPIYPGADGEQIEDDVAAVNKYSRKRLLEERSKKRSRVGMSQYIPSDKKYIFASASQNAHYKPVPRQSRSSQPEEGHTTGRKRVSESRISSMFYNTSAVQASQDMGSHTLKRQHNLLRAIVRTKMTQQQNVKVSEYEQSFQRMVENLGNVKIKPIVEKGQVNQEESSRTYRSLQISSEKPKRSTLSNRKRLQFENCLNWSKKHRKNGSFYAEKLGKNPQIENKNSSLEKRKQILQAIHKRSSSVSFSEFI